MQGAVEHGSGPAFGMEALAPSAAESVTADFLQPSSPSLETPLGWKELLCPGRCLRLHLKTGGCRGLMSDLAPRRDNLAGPSQLLSLPQDRLDEALP